MHRTFLGIALIVGMIATLPTTIGDSPASYAKGDVEVHGTGLAVYCEDTSALKGFSLNAESITVRVEETRYREVAHPLIGTTALLEETRTVRTYTLHEARATLAAGNHAGWMGIRPEGFPLQVRADEVEVESAVHTMLGETQTDNLDRTIYSETITGPHLILTATGALNVKGSFILVLRGPDLHLSSRENETLLRSGTERSDQAPAYERTETVLILHVEGGSLTSHLPFRAATEDLALSWKTGAMLLEVPVEGPGTALLSPTTGGGMVEGMGTGVAAPVPNGIGPLAWVLGAFILLSGTVVGYMHIRYRRNADGTMVPVEVHGEQLAPSPVVTKMLAALIAAGVLTDVRVAEAEEVAPVQEVK